MLPSPFEKTLIKIQSAQSKTGSESRVMRKLQLVEPELRFKQSENFAFISFLFEIFPVDIRKDGFSLYIWFSYIYISTHIEIMRNQFFSPSCKILYLHVEQNYSLVYQWSAFAIKAFKVLCTFYFYSDYKDVTIRKILRFLIY